MRKRKPTRSDLNLTSKNNKTTKNTKSKLVKSKQKQNNETIENTKQNKNESKEPHSKWGPQEAMERLNNGIVIIIVPKIHVFYPITFSLSAASFLTR